MTPDQTGSNANGSGASTSPASSPPGTSVQISALTRTGSGVEFQFQTAPGAAYRLEGTDDLAGGKWEVLIERLEGTSDLLHFRDPEAPALRQYFYRFLRLP